MGAGKAAARSDLSTTSTTKQTTRTIGRLLLVFLLIAVFSLLTSNQSASMGQQLLEEIKTALAVQGDDRSTCETTLTLEDIEPLISVERKCAASRKQEEFCPFYNQSDALPPVLEEQDGERFIPSLFNFTTENDVYVEIILSAADDLVSRAIMRHGTQMDKQYISWWLEKIASYSKLEGINASELTFLDIGANVGWYTVNIGAAAGVKVVAFEPMPQNLYLLRNSLCRVANQDLAKRVTLLDMGLSNTTQQCVMMSDNGNKGDGIMRCAENGTEIEIRRGYSERARVDLDLLDNVVQETSQKVVGAKIDVEGFESHVLHGATQLFSSPIPFVQVEWAKSNFELQGGDRAFFVSFLLEAGYNIYHKGSKLDYDSLLAIQNGELQMVHQSVEEKLQK